jgi:hypothetical protein
MNCYLGQMLTVSIQNENNSNHMNLIDQAILIVLRILNTFEIHNYKTMSCESIRLKEIIVTEN